MKVLVVEDDTALGLFLQKGLMLEGHEVDWVGDGLAALAHVESGRPDLIVLDLSLPLMDGTEVLRQVRAKFRDISVLVLTGRSDVEERVRCLKAGADDCVVKPFSFHELVARCMGILGRKGQHSDPILCHGDIQMDRINRNVRRNGHEIALTVKEFALLEFLLLRRGESCNRAELLREVWQMSAETPTNIVDVYVNYLRKKLGAAHGPGETCAAAIETVRGTGYRLRGEAVAHVAEHVAVA